METKTVHPPGLGPIRNQPVLLQPVQVSNKMTVYQSKSSLVISVLQIVGGVVILLLGLGTGLSALTRKVDMSMLIIDTGHSIILLVICGGIGIGASKKKTKCLIIAHMVLCILATISVFSSMLRALISVIQNADALREDGGSYGYDYMSRDSQNYAAQEHSQRIESDYAYSGWSPDARTKLSLGMGSVLILVCLVEFIVSIKGSALACKVTCCCGCNQNTGNSGMQYGQVDPANTYMVVIDGQVYPAVSGAIGQNQAVVPGAGATVPSNKEQEALGPQDKSSGQFVA